MPRRDGVHCGIERTQGKASPLQEGSTFGRELERARGAVLQEHTERTFQASHILAHSGRRDAQGASRCSETATNSHLHKGKYRAYALCRFHDDFKLEANSKSKWPFATRLRAIDYGRLLTGTQESINPTATFGCESPPP